MPYSLYVHADRFRKQNENYFTKINKSNKRKFCRFVPTTNRIMIIYYSSVYPLI